MSGFRPRFFSSQGGLVPPNEVTLRDEDSHHALRVLRLRKGDECEVVVDGLVYAAFVSRAEDPVRVKLVARLEGAAAGAVYRSQVGLVQVLARLSLFDQVLEKGTEVGASFFVCVPAGAGTRLSGQSRVHRLARWHRIVSEAAKQSKQVVIPSVDWTQSVEQALIELKTRGADSVVLDPAARATLRDVLAPGSAGTTSLALWVGPESGWSSIDLEQFAEAGAATVRMGHGVLRSETAGPVAVAMSRLLLGDW